MKSDSTRNKKINDTKKEISGNKEKTLLYASVFLTGMAGIVLEIAFTRIFSIALWHHFAFLSIAIALFGLGVSGVFLSLYPQAIKTDFFNKMHKFSWLFSISIIIAFFVFSRIHLDVRNLGNISNLVKFGVFFLFLAIPFFWNGCIISSIIAKKSELVQKIYFYDLIGSGVGCLAVVLLISTLTGQGMVLFAALMTAVASVLFLLLSQSGKVFKKQFSIIIYIIGLIILIPSSSFLFPVPLPKDKALYHYIYDEGSKIVDSKWNSFSRIDAFSPVPSIMWGLSDKFPGKLPEQIGITIDGDGFTSIVKNSDNSKNVEYPFWTLNSFVHSLNKNRTALIIGSGGGIDVLSALKQGTRQIDAVEINPSITDLVKNKYREFSGNLFFQPGVTLTTAEGRNFVKRTGKKYGLLYLPLVDSWAATYSGAYSLSENFLYTVEAFRDYSDHVLDNGFISISRWEYKMPDQPYQTYRLSAMAVKASGKDLRNSVVVLAQGKLANFIWKKGDFTKDEINQIKDFTGRCGFQMLYYPGIQNNFSLLLNPATSGDFINNYPLDISPVTDDRPFFYLTDKWKYIGFYINNLISLGKPLPIVFTMIITVLLISSVFSLIFIFLPLYVKDRDNFAGILSFEYLLYFMFLGLGFMILEVTLMTKFTLFLGHPTFSLAITLFSLLIFTGTGSFLSSTFKSNDVKILKFSVFILVLTGILYFVFLDRIFASLLPASLVSRCAVSMLLIAPIGLCMGMPFPLGLKKLGELNNIMIPWAWGINGCASVLGSTLSLVFSQSFGFRITMLISLVLYIFALFVYVLKNRTDQQKLL